MAAPAPHRPDPGPHDADPSDPGPHDPDRRLAQLAGAIAEPARARMLGALMDGHARTATELAALAGVAASTASAHLARLREAGLLALLAQGRHRYFRIAGPEVAATLEGLMVLAGVGRGAPFTPNTPPTLRAARTCYDHLAGRAAVVLHDRLHAHGWLAGGAADGGGYQLTPQGAVALESLGLDLQAALASRRRFACACLDWSERRPHLGGALGAAWLQLALRRGWARQALDGRAVTITPRAHRELPELFGAAPA